MKRKTKSKKRVREQDLLVDVQQTFSGEDELAFEFADDDEGVFFEADFDMEEEK